MYIYKDNNIASPEHNEYKFGDPSCRGLALCTDADHYFCTISVLLGLDMFYMYLIYIYI